MTLKKGCKPLFHINERLATTTTTRQASRVGVGALTNPTIRACTGVEKRTFSMVNDGGLRFGEGGGSNDSRVKRNEKRKREEKERKLQRN